MGALLLVDLSDKILFCPWSTGSVDNVFRALTFRSHAQAVQLVQLLSREKYRLYSGWGWSFLIFIGAGLSPSPKYAGQGSERVSIIN